MKDLQIIKRNGDVVSFEAEKIRNVILKAFKANNQHISDEVLNEIVYGVVSEVRQRFLTFLP
ncbi:MAG: ATP cone domain-containing protein, partial [Nanoarchaeota archaeon]|nr:ATP cone domain-containing protein [Nanoarchaeota archaeon]